MSKAKARVLSIQSHVVRGYVGNKCATLPLQLHQIEVDAINSVQFSTHTYYAHWKGQVLNSDQLNELYEGLRLCDLTRRYTHLLTGYCRDETFLRRVAEIIRDLRTLNPALYYICDPVLGDRDKYYVPEQLMPIYRDVILPLANVVTPNQFELQQLSGMAVTDETSCLKAIDVLHGRGNANVVVSSTELGGSADKMLVYGSSRQPDGKTSRFRYTIRKLGATFVGTGDLFTALLLAWLHKTDHNLCVAVGNVLRSMQAILRTTTESAAAELRAEGLQRAAGPAELELRLVDCIDALRQPPNMSDFVEPVVILQ